VNQNRRTATVVGVLFIIGTVAGGVGAAVTKPTLGAPDYLVQLSANQFPVTLGALLTLVMAAACAGIGISLYPILKKYNEGLALGAAGFRIMEGVLDIVGVIGLILLLALAQEFVKAGAPSASYFQTLGALLTTGCDWVNTVAVLLTWCIGALIYYAVFYQTRLVPRWLAGWGLVGCSLTIVGSLLVMFQVITPWSTAQGVMNLPIALQEMVLAVWLIAKGFNPSAAASMSAKTATNELLSAARVAQ